MHRSLGLIPEWVPSHTRKGRCRFGLPNRTCGRRFASLNLPCRGGALSKKNGEHESLVAVERRDPRLASNSSPVEVPAGYLRSSTE